MGYFGLMDQYYIFASIGYFCIFIGFCVVAYWTAVDKVKHLALVAFFVWLTGAPEHLLLGYFKEWFLSVFVIYLCAMGGWWLSRYFPKADHIFKKPT